MEESWFVSQLPFQLSKCSWVESNGVKLIGINSFGEFVRLSQSLSSRRCHSLIAGFLYPSPVAAIYSLCTTGRKQSTLSLSRRDEGLPTKKTAHYIWYFNQSIYVTILFVFQYFVSTNSNENWVQIEFCASTTVTTQRVRQTGLSLYLFPFVL